MERGRKHRCGVSQLSINADVLTPPSQSQVNQTAALYHILSLHLSLKCYSNLPIEVCFKLHTVLWCVLHQTKVLSVSLFPTVSPSQSHRSLFGSKELSHKQLNVLNFPKFSLRCGKHCILYTPLLPAQQGPDRSRRLECPIVTHQKSPCMASPSSTSHKGLKVGFLLLSFWHTEMKYNQSFIPDLKQWAPSFS